MRVAHSASPLDAAAGQSRLFLHEQGQPRGTPGRPVSAYCRRDGCEERRRERRRCRCVASAALHVHPAREELSVALRSQRRLDAPLLAKVGTEERRKAAFSTSSLPTRTSLRAASCLRGLGKVGVESGPTPLLARALPPEDEDSLARRAGPAHPQPELGSVAVPAVPPQSMRQPGASASEILVMVGSPPWKGACRRSWRCGLSPRPTRARVAVAHFGGGRQRHCVRLFRTGRRFLIRIERRSEGRRRQRPSGVGVTGTRAPRALRRWCVGATQPSPHARCPADRAAARLLVTCDAAARPAKRRSALLQAAAAEIDNFRSC